MRCVLKQTLTYLILFGTFEAQQACSLGTYATLQLLPWHGTSSQGCSSCWWCLALHERSLHCSWQSNIIQQGLRTCSGISYIPAEEAVTFLGTYHLSMSKQYQQDI